LQVLIQQTISISEIFEDQNFSLGTGT
jgi:hypothetical protein